MGQANASVKLYVYISATWVQLHDVQPIRGSWGISSNKPFDRLADIGEVTFALNNKDGLYTPDGAGALSGWKKGLPFKMVVTYDGSDYVKFRGAISEIKIRPTLKDPKAYITALDWLDYASRYPIQNPVLLENSTTDDGIIEIVSNLPIAPQATSYDAGLSTYPTIFDSVKDFTTGYKEFGKLAISEPGYVYMRKDIDNGETLVFEAYDHRNGTNTLTTIPSGAGGGFLLKEDGGYLLQENGDKLILDSTESAVFDNVMMSFEIDYGENITNHVVASAYPKRTDTVSVKLYDLEKALPIAGGETKTFKVKYTNPNGGNPINALAPVQDTYTKALLHMEGLYVGDPTLLDETNRVWTTHSVETVNNIVKIGSWSAYFDGGASYMSTADSPDFNFGTGDFTVEWYEYRFNATSGRCVFSRDYSASFPAFLIGNSDGTNSTVSLSSAGASFDIANAKSFGAITANAWVHYALVREGTTFTMYKDGVNVNSFSSAAALQDMNATMTIGRKGSAYITACIDEVRISKGIARYTADFTPTKIPLYLTGTFAAIWTGSDGTGTDLTPDMTLSASYYTNGALITITNGSDTSGYVTSLKTLGYGIYSFSSIDDTQESTDSINEFGHQSEELRQSYQQNLYIGKPEIAKVLEQEKQPRTILNKVNMSANRSASQMIAFLVVDVGDLVHLTITEAGIDAYFYIQGVSFEMQKGLINYSWIVREAFTLENGLSALGLNFAGGSATDAINFGYLPIISGDQVTKRIWSVWVVLDSVPTVNNYIIMGTDNDTTGAMLMIKQHATDKYVSFVTNRWDGGGGQWTNAANQLTLNNNHILIVEDLTNVSTDPIMYVNGALQTLTEDATPSGALKTEIGSDLIIGNRRTLSGVYAECFDGVISAPRIYDGNLIDVSALTGVYANGSGYIDTVYDGMLFYGFYCRSRDGTSYNGDVVLDSEQKVLDGYLGYVGTPNGGVICNLD